jgi:hypothetical protein
MIIEVKKYKSPDGKLFDRYEDADNHWKVQLGIESANQAYHRGASLWQAIRYIPTHTLWSEWRSPSEFLKLVHRDSLFWDMNSHLSVWRIDPDLSIVCCQKDVHNGTYTWDGGYLKTLDLYSLVVIVKNHAFNHGLASAKPADLHWYNRR